MTRAAFLAEYERRVVATYSWVAADPARFARFMDAVRRSFTDSRPHWQWDGPLAIETWRAIGCKGRMTFKGLCALP